MPTANIEAPEKAKEFVFLLLPQFSMMAFAAAIEPLRIANRMSRRELFAWRLATEGGNPVACSNGTVVAADIGLEDLPRDSAIVVCAGVGLREASTRPVLRLPSRVRAT